MGEERREAKGIAETEDAAVRSETGGDRGAEGICRVGGQVHPFDS